MISNMTLILVLMTALAFVLVLCDEVAGGHGGRMAESLRRDLRVASRAGLHFPGAMECDTSPRMRGQLV